MKPRYWFYLFVLLIIAFTGCYILDEIAEKGEVWHIGPFLGGVLVTAGWVVTSELGIRNAKNQHTMNIITQQAFDKHRLENRDLIQKSLPSFKSKLTADMVRFDDETSPLLKAIDLELNFFEFMAAAVFRDNLDERLLIDTLRGRFCSFYRQNEDYIMHWRKQGNTWENIERLYRRWARTKHV